ncbi:FAD-dependent oxidoreductase [Pleionea sp. CnH1-48]|uniref:flavin monoamine oxidase family protein n=1 Tax=Pleionea sp. CnH1-48 TaxID=2954494 RepID=UPI002097FFBC|nr:FAD-dependent oxidoreductase [Pleionea sp. CnH1-48]MCO7223513.1 FAD-dependent oxidoreductase [Pleionea sp. CnH1-48]
MKLTRRDFVRVSALLGLSGGISSLFAKSKNKPSHVIIVGAGAAGLSAGYLLAQLGIDFKILEASSVYGGRLKTSTDFADFPVSLGAEWLHVNPNILVQIAQGGKTAINVPTIGYKHDDKAVYWDGEELEEVMVGKVKDRKFVGGSWLNFFEDYILPSVKEHISYNTIVESIDYSKKKVSVSTRSKQNYEADKVILTASLRLLQDQDIGFFPQLPESKLVAIKKATMWKGIKIFMKFSKKFYPTFVVPEDIEDRSGQILFYDAAYGQDTSENILGFFAVGKPAEPYLSLSGNNLRDFVLSQLDHIFGGAASRSFIKFIVQNWQAEPFVKAAYLQDYESLDVVEALSLPINKKVYFAGEAYAGREDWGGVHTATQSARTAVEQMMS